MINLFVNIFTPESAERQTELYTCCMENWNNPLISRVFYLTEDKTLYDKFHGQFERLQILLYDHRPTFNSFFALTQPYTEDINIIANLDIYFDETLLFVMKPNVLKQKDVMALSRWDKVADEIIHYNQIDSQDVWIKRGAFPLIPEANFTMGVPGCDNRIAYLLARSGLNVTNPSKSIHAIHLHETGIRSYSRETTGTVPPPYKLLTPHAL